MRSCYLPEYREDRAGPRHPCPATVRTIRLTISKRPLMKPKLQGSPRHRRADPGRARPTPPTSARATILQRRSPARLILQPAALLLLPAMRNSFLLVAINSRQLTNVIIVSSASTRILNA